ncbi:MAG: phosphoribosyl transferase [Verrucomicrobia bacterium Tous-C9LFEB]|nr:MAG: phosphoribosyl transferase [Verrucomicrobia bacterium Tous-C9LFEB]
MHFKDRFQAGQALANKLTAYKDRNDVQVLALPRGGVLVGYEVAKALPAPLDVLVVRKLGLPEYPELAIGALAAGDVDRVSPAAVEQFHVTPEALQCVIDAERNELHRREHCYRGNRPLPDLKSKIVILVDDGIATGLTMQAAILSVQQHNPARVVVAAPVGAADSCAELARMADEVVCASIPRHFDAVGAWYGHFEQTTDAEILELLEHIRLQPAL